MGGGVVRLRAVSERWLITVRILSETETEPYEERGKTERRQDHAADGINANRMLASIAAFSGEESVSVESCFNTEASLCRSGGGTQWLFNELKLWGGVPSSRQQIAKGSNR